MRPSILILTLIFLMAVSVPAVAYTVASGSFSMDAGVKTNLTEGYNVVPVNGGIYGIYFRSAQSIPQLGAVKMYMDDNFHSSNYLLNISVNSSATSASLTYGGSVVSTGTLYFNRNDLTNDLYLVYFTDTWNPSSVPDRSTLYLNFDRDVFNIEFLTGIWDPTNAGYTRFDQNLLFAGFTTSGGGGVYVPYPGLAPNYGFQTDYNDIWLFQYATAQNTGGLTSHLNLIRFINGIYYNSRVQVNETYPSGGQNFTVYDNWGTTDYTLSSITNQRIVYLNVWDPDLRHYEASFNLSSTYETPPLPGIGDLYVYTYDGSIASLLNGVTVTKTDLDDPSLNGWGTSGVIAPGRTDFQGLIGHSYNFSATSTGFSTAYANYTLTSFPAIVKLYLFPTIGTSTLEFYITANSTGLPLSGVPVKITNTTGTQGKMTVAGFARFGTVSGFNYGWTVAEGMGTCDNCYVPVSGNVTATTGQTRIEKALSTYGEAAGGGAGGGGPSSPHQAAEDVMETIYSMLPSLLMLVFLFLFLGVMGYNPGRMMRR